jgi:DNA-directed RNA polymerase specialized sigma24 family protein
MAYEIQLKNSGPEVVDADGYVQEGLLTTFFQGRDGRAVLDSWARRIASYRTADIIRIRWTAPSEGRHGEVSAPRVTQLKAS